MKRVGSIFNAKAQRPKGARSGERRIRRRKTLFEGMHEEEDFTWLIDISGGGIFGVRWLATALMRPGLPGRSGRQAALLKAAASRRSPKNRVTFFLELPPKRFPMLYLFWKVGNLKGDVLNTFGAAESI